MTVEIRPTWDPSGTVSVRVSSERAELVVSGEGELRQFCLVEQRPECLGWVERSLEAGLVGRRRVSVREVMCGCLREWEAEQAVGELTEAAVRRAQDRGGRWRAPAGRLRKQLSDARRGARISNLPFQVLFRHRSGSTRDQPLSASVAAERVGWVTAAGRPDTQRLKRRMGLAEQKDNGGERFQRAVGYRTGLALCQAIDVDPVELGL